MTAETYGQVSQLAPAEVQPSPTSHPAGQLTKPGGAGHPAGAAHTTSHAHASEQ